MRRRRQQRGEKGSVIIIAMLLLIVIGILLPMVVNLFHKNTKDTVKTNAEGSSLHLARAGIEKGLWRLNRDPETLETVAQGGRIDKYDGTFEHSDYIESRSETGISWWPSGVYRILLSSGSAPHQFLIRSAGTTLKRQKWATLRSLYDDCSLGSALYIEADPNLVDYSTPYTLTAAGAGTGPEIHWGPMKSLRAMDLSQSSVLYPRKYSSGRINGRDTGSNTVSNTDNIEYWANYKGVGTPPEFNLEKMKQQAINHNTYMGGSTYFNFVSSPVVNLIWNADEIWYFDGDVTIQGPVFIRGILIVKGNLTITEAAVGANPAGAMDGTAIPENASLEYTKQVAQVGGYPADSGLQGNPYAPSYNFPVGTVGIKGFVYVGQNLTVTKTSAANPFTIYGSVYVKRIADLGNQNSFKIYRGDFKNGALMWPLITRPTLELNKEDQKFSDQDPG